LAEVCQSDLAEGERSVGLGLYPLVIWGGMNRSINIVGYGISWKDDGKPVSNDAESCATGVFEPNQPRMRLPEKISSSSEGEKHCAESFKSPSSLPASYQTDTELDTGILTCVE
jgi:hypothetical protein